MKTWRSEKQRALNALVLNLFEQSKTCRPKPMKILHSLTAGLLSSTSILARRVAFPLLFLGAGLLLAQPCAAGIPASSIIPEASPPDARYHTATFAAVNGKVLVAEGSWTAPTNSRDRGTVRPGERDLDELPEASQTHALPLHGRRCRVNSKVHVARRVSIKAFSSRNVRQSGRRDLDGHRPSPSHRTPVCTATLLTAEAARCGRL